MQVSVIIVNYRSAMHIIDCIRSAMAFSSGTGFEWIVVDNQSGDDSKERICSEFPFVHWVEMGYNAGFARANNQGMRLAKGDVLLLLNPDTLILEDAIQKCFAQFINTNHAACGVQLLYEDFRPQISGSYFVKGGVNHIMPIPYWGSFLSWIAKKMHARKPGVERAADSVKVDWVSGAFLMVKKQILSKAGMMDEDFFLYAEEVEWCSRLQKHGEIFLYGNIRIIHLMGESITRATNSVDKSYENIFDKKGLQLIVSNHLRIRKQYGLGWFFFQLLNYTWGLLFFVVCSLLKHLLQFKNPFTEYKQITGLSKNVFILWSLLPKIVANKPHFYKMF